MHAENKVALRVVLFVLRFSSLLFFAVGSFASSVFLLSVVLFRFHLVFEDFQKAPARCFRCYTATSTARTKACTSTKQRAKAYDALNMLLTCTSSVTDPCSPQRHTTSQLNALAWKTLSLVGLLPHQETFPPLLHVSLLKAFPHVQLLAKEDHAQLLRQSAKRY